MEGKQNANVIPDFLSGSCHGHLVVPLSWESRYHVGMVRGMCDPFTSKQVN